MIPLLILKGCNVYKLDDNGRKASEVLVTTAPHFKSLGALFGELERLDDCLMMLHGVIAIYSGEVPNVVPDAPSPFLKGFLQEVTEANIMLQALCDMLQGETNE